MKIISKLFFLYFFYSHNAKAAIEFKSSHKKLKLQV